MGTYGVTDTVESRKTIKTLWKRIYGDVPTVEPEEAERLLSSFFHELDRLKPLVSTESNGPVDWYKDAVVYSTYVDRFNRDFNGLKDKLDYLQDLGITCLWLLPILDSPMTDAGFDISDYCAIRPDLLGLGTEAKKEEKDAVFSSFVEAAHRRGIHIIFDIAINHCSDKHKWFQEARKSRESKYRDYFIWRDDSRGYEGTRVIFKGMSTSNWEYDEKAGQYYFHRFFRIQPDLNYRNPEVLIEMSRVLVGWRRKGVDGFRADAVPYIWKEEGTTCENLPKTHLVVKFFRAVLDYFQEGSLLLAEACQKPHDVVEYFGNGDECNAAYHFPVMPRIYHALAVQNRRSILRTLTETVTPAIPENSQWFMFLRCHDELTLEMVTPLEREQIYGTYCRDPQWDFRQGEGISARIAELFDFDEKRILLAFSIMFTLLGTPIIYYGDEFAKGNDTAYFLEKSAETGFADSRYLVRGRIDWENVDTTLGVETSLGYKVYHAIRKMIRARGELNVFGRGLLEFVDAVDQLGEVNGSVLAYVRVWNGRRVLAIHNLSNKPQSVNFREHLEDIGATDILGTKLTWNENGIELKEFGFLWLSDSNSNR